MSGPHWPWSGVAGDGDFPKTQRNGDLVGGVWDLRSAATSGARGWLLFSGLQAVGPRSDGLQSRERTVSGHHAGMTAASCPSWPSPQASGSVGAEWKLKHV